MPSNFKMDWKGWLPVGIQWRWHYYPSPPYEKGNGEYLYYLCWYRPDKEYRQLGLSNDWYDGPINSFGFWWFTISYCTPLSHKAVGLRKWYMNKVEGLTMSDMFPEKVEEYKDGDEPSQMWAGWVALAGAGVFTLGSAILAPWWFTVLVILGLAVLMFNMVRK